MSEQRQVPVHRQRVFREGSDVLNEDILKILLKYYETVFLMCIFIVSNVSISFDRKIVGPSISVDTGPKYHVLDHQKNKGEDWEGHHLEITIL